MRPSPLTFALLLAVELALLRLSLSRYPRLAFPARIAMFVVPLALALGLRAYQALGTPGILEWDETYYLSLAVTAADGRGLYPFIFGYAEMPIMGGLGYAAYAYALAVEVAGPNILALRTVSLLASVAGLVCLWWLLRTLYGSGAAWMGAALAAALRLFVMSNSIRMDSFTFAWVAAALLAVAIAFKRWEPKRWHLLAGLMFGLGLQVHIDTVVTAFACGLLYLFTWLRDARARRRLAVPVAMLLYVAGWALGLALFVCANILPDPEAFYKTTVLIRVDATNWYSSGTSSLLGSFLDPRILLAKEAERYGVLFRSLHALEILLAVTAVAALAVRRGRVDTLVLLVIAGVLVGAAIVLNNASPLYFIHVMPALTVPMAPLFSHGFSRYGKVSTRELTPASLLAFAIVISALCAVNNVRSVRSGPPPVAQEAQDAAFAQTARALVDRNCRIAGDASLYVRHFADYPYFISARPTEVAYAMLFYGATDEAEYWDRKAPDAVVMPGPLSEGLAAYVAKHHLAPAHEGIWLARDGCTPAR